MALLVMLLPTIVFFLIFFFLKKNQKVAARIFLIAGIASVVFVTGLWIFELSNTLANNHYNRISNIIQRDLIMPADEHQQKYLLLGLSNAAEGYANYAQTNPEQKTACITQLELIIDFVTDEENYPTVANKRLWKNNTFYLLHLNNILSNYVATVDSDSISPTHRNINNYLADGIIQSRFKNTKSFSGDDTYWTADNAQILKGLYQFDQLAKTNSVNRPQKDWVNFVSREVAYEESNLLCSSFTDKNKCKEMPHGTQLATTVSSLYQCSPEKAKKIWREYKHHYKTNTFGIFATFGQYHPDELAPAYQNQNHHPLDALHPNFATLKAAAVFDDKLTYFQIANQLWFKETFGNTGDKRMAPEYRWKAFYKMSLRFSAATVF
jgi:hypothetical protein